MSYTALYRKFRPAAFADVKGQDPIVTTLKNQIQSDRIGHAYLFCGTRGTGKTSVAKIFAKAVNCEHPMNGEPCGTCACCRAIAEGTSLNVIEIDAASNNGVDNIRQIREDVQYRPTQGRFLVYIIDEVHMLSAGAFNALLKTLEEPPAYVIFILATTEVNKIPVTILSRCQRYDFHRITTEVIAGRLRELADAEGEAADDQALLYLARAGDGSMRDAVSLLDQCIGFYPGQELTYGKVLDVLGAVDTEVYSRLLEQILAQDAGEAVLTLDDLFMQGRDIGQLVGDFTWYLRNLLLLQTTQDHENLLDISSENLADMEKLASRVSTETLMRFIRICSDLSNQIRYSAQKRTEAEIAVIRLCRPQMEENYDSILQRLDSLERQVQALFSASFAPEGAAQNLKAAQPGESNQPLQSPKVTQPNQPEPYGTMQSPSAPEGAAQNPKAMQPGQPNQPPADQAEDDAARLLRSWPSVIARLGGLARSFLSGAVPAPDENGGVVLTFSNRTAYDYFTKEHEKALEVLKKTADELMGISVPVSVRLQEGGTVNEASASNRPQQGTAQRKGSSPSRQKESAEQKSGPSWELSDIIRYDIDEEE